MLVSVRSTLSAGVAASLVAVGAVTAAPPHALSLALVTSAASSPVSSPAVQLAAAIAPLLQPVPPAPAAASPKTFTSANAASATGTAGDWIINGYNRIQPWVQYGVNLAAWAVSWTPWPIGLLGPQANILYSGWQPIGQALAYSAAYLLDRQFDLIGPTLVNGVKTGINNLVQGEIQWVLSFFPPLPPLPFPVFPGAATVAVPRVAAARAAAATTATPVADAGTEATPATARVRRSAHSQSAPTPVATLASPAPAAAAAVSADEASTPSADPAPAPKARKIDRGAKVKAKAGNPGAASSVASPTRRGGQGALAN